MASDGRSCVGLLRLVECLGAVNVTGTVASNGSLVDIVGHSMPLITFLELIPVIIMLLPIRARSIVLLLARIRLAALATAPVPRPQLNDVLVVSGVVATRAGLVARTIVARSLICEHPPLRGVPLPLTILRRGVGILVLLAAVIL